MKEIWKDIIGYEDSYQVSNLGRVKSKERIDAVGHPWHSRILKPCPQKSGYLNVDLSRNHSKKKLRVHRLVALAFIPNPNDLPEVNHLNEDKTDNRVCNLEWCSTQDNLKYGTRGLRQSLTQSKSASTVSRLRGLATEQRKSVDQYTLDGRFVRKWESMSAAKEAGFTPGGVSACCYGQIKYHHGYVFRFHNPLRDNT